ncbi:MAG: hemerythrin domain-containing protein [Thermoplasmata archaeon]
MKPTEELKREHRAIERMLEIVRKASDRLERGEEVDPRLFMDAADFFRNFADRCHHSKEEKLLFEKMVARGIPRTSGPIAVMLREHDDGRSYVKRIAYLTEKSITPRTRSDLVEAGRGYFSLLSAHIDKEDNILYPMADEVLLEKDQEELERGFEEVEKSIMGPGVHEMYHKMIEKWEKKLK